MATFWDNSKGPLFGYGPDYYRRNAADQRRYDKETKNYPNSSAWMFTGGHIRHKLEEFNKNKYWRSAYPNESLTVYYVESPLLPTGSGEWQFVEIKDHYGECIRLPFAMVSVALEELSPYDLSILHSKPDAAKRIALLIVNYCIRNALICSPIEELNI